MLFLWVFGTHGDSMKKWKFVISYLLGGVVANLAGGGWAELDGARHRGRQARGVLGGYALLYPRTRRYRDGSDP